MRLLILISVLSGLVNGALAETDLSFEDGTKAVQRKMITADDRRGVRRWTFELSDKSEIIDLISGETTPIKGYGTSIKRVKGHTVTSDEIRTPKALEFNGKSYLSCGQVKEWKTQVNRTMAFYLKKAPGNQPNAVLFYQQGKGESAIHVALGPRGDGTDFVARFGGAVWEGVLSEPIRDNVWTHLIITQGHPGIRVHVDTHENPMGSKGKLIAPTGELLMGGAPDQPSFRGRSCLKF